MINAEFAVVAWASIGALTSAVTLPITVRYNRGFSWAEPAIQVGATAGLFGTLVWRWGSHIDVLVPSALALTTVPLALIDARTHRLPNPLILTSYIAVTAATVATAIEEPSTRPLRILIGALIFFTFHGALYVIFPSQLGGGDVKLALSLGAVTGWSAWSSIFLGLLAGWGLAAMTQLSTRFFRSKQQSDKNLPLGPFLIAGTLLIVLVI